MRHWYTIHEIAHEHQMPKWEIASVAHYLKLSFGYLEWDSALSTSAKNQIDEFVLNPPVLNGDEEPVSKPKKRDTLVVWKQLLDKYSAERMIPVYGY